LLQFAKSPLAEQEQGGASAMPSLAAQQHVMKSDSLRQAAALIGFRNPPPLPDWLAKYPTKTACVIIVDALTTEREQLSSNWSLEN
jgi:hypothetical protein